MLMLMLRLLLGPVVEAVELTSSRWKARLLTEGRVLWFGGFVVKKIPKLRPGLGLRCCRQQTLSL